MPMQAQAQRAAHPSAVEPGPAPLPPSRPDGAPFDDAAGQAAVNPFSTLGTVLQQPAPPVHAPVAHLEISVVVTIAGMAAIGSLLRRLVD